MASSWRSTSPSLWPPWKAGSKWTARRIDPHRAAQRRHAEDDNPIQVPAVLSFIAYGTFSSNVKGLLAFPEDQWPQNIELLYYSFHIMAGLGDDA